MSSEHQVRRVIAALMERYGSTQADMAAVLGVHQSQLSRKLGSSRPLRAGAHQRRGAGLSWQDLDRVAAHYGLAPADVVAGWEHVRDVLDARGR